MSLFAFPSSFKHVIDRICKEWGVYPDPVVEVFVDVVWFHGEDDFSFVDDHESGADWFCFDVYVEFFGEFFNFFFVFVYHYFDIDFSFFEFSECVFEHFLFVK